MFRSIRLKSLSNTDLLETLSLNNNESKAINRYLIKHTVFSFFIFNIFAILIGNEKRKITTQTTIQGGLKVTCIPLKCLPLQIFRWDLWQRTLVTRANFVQLRNCQHLTQWGGVETKFEK